MKKKRNKKLLVISILLIVIMAMSVVITYAIDLAIRSKYSFIAATDTLVIDSSGTYHGEGLLSNEDYEISRIHNPKSEIILTAFDLLIFSKDDIRTFVNGDEVQPKSVCDVKNDTVGRLCYIFEDLSIVTGSTVFSVNSSENFDAVVISSEVSYKTKAYNLPNVYVDSLLTLSLANNHKLYSENNRHNQAFYSNECETDERTEAYSNLYFINDIILDEQIVFRAASYINFLYSKVHLNQDFYIRHSYPGVFVFQNTLGGEAESVTASYETEYIDGQMQDVYKKIRIETPYAYYKTAPAINDDYITKTDSKNLSNLESVTQAVCFDALHFAYGRLEEYIFGNLQLPTKYQNYDTEISYQSGDEAIFSSSGVVTRGEQTQTTTVTVTVKVNIFETEPEDTMPETEPEIEDTMTKTVYIVGTSQSAIIKAYADLFDSKVRKSYDVIDITQTDADTQEKITTTNIYNFDRLLDIADIARDMLIKSAQSTITFTAESGGVFIYTDESLQSFRGDSVTLQLGQNGVFGISELINTDGIVETDAHDELNPESKIYLGFNGLNSKLTLKISIGVNSSFLSYNIVRQKSDVIKVIERYMNTPYIASINDYSNVYYLDQSGMLVNDSQEILNDYSIFVVDEITSGVIKLTSEQYDALLADNTLIDDYKNNPELQDDEGIFTIEDGKLSAPNVISSPEFIFVLWQQFDFASGVYEDESPYTTFRIIEIPRSGISGGDKYEEYLSGDYFAANFQKSRILSGDTVGLLETLNGVYMNVRFVDVGNLAAIYDFIKFAADPLNGETIIFDYATFDSGEGKSQYFSGGDGSFYDDDNLLRLKSLYFAIDLEKIPTTNTSITFEVEFFYIDGESGELVSINIETYSFITPGIYRSELDFDKNIYDYMIYCITADVGNRDSFAKFNTIIAAGSEELEQYVYLEDGLSLLLTDGARIFTELYATRVNIENALSSVVFGSGIDTHGFEYVTNLKTLDLSGVPLQSLEGLSVATNIPLTTLRLAGCGITYARLGQNLSRLRNLTTVDLSYNSIASLEGILYRTVTFLDISNQTALAAIDEIEELYNLQTVNLSNNQILSFEPLRYLKELKAVTLYGNSPVSADAPQKQYFGTGGYSNIPVYVHLIIENVAIYADSGQPQTALRLDKAAPSSYPNGTDLGYLTIKQWNSALILNGITFREYQDDLTNLDFPSEVKSGVNGVVYYLDTRIDILSMGEKRVFIIRIASASDASTDWEQQVYRQITIYKD